MVGLVEPPLCEGDHMVDGLPGLAPRCGHLDPMAAQGTQRGHPGQARRRHRACSRIEIEQLNPGVVEPGLLDQASRGARVKAMPVGDLDDGRQGRGLRGAAHLIESRRSWRAEVGLLGRQRADRFGRDFGGTGAAGSSDGCHDESLDQRRGAQRRAFTNGGIDHVERHLGREHGAAQVHQDDDAVAVVRAGDGLDDGGGVGAEGGRVEARRYGDAHLAAMQHLRGQGNRRVSQCPAV